MNTTNEKISLGCKVLTAIALTTTLAPAGCGSDDSVDSIDSIDSVGALDQAIDDAQVDVDAEARAERHIERELQRISETDYDETITVSGEVWETERVVHDPATLLQFDANIEREPEPDRGQPQPYPVIHPDVEQALEQGGDIEVIVAIRKHSQLPQLPDLIVSEARESEANQIVLRRRDSMLGAAASQRALERAPVLDEIRRQGGTVVEEFTFGNAAWVRLPATAVRTLATNPDVVHIEPVRTTVPPPDAFTDNDVDDGRAWINADTYYDHGFDGQYAYAGLMDTGVRTSHTMFNSPDYIAYERDCVQGGVNCSDTSNPNYNTDDDCWNHGTRTAAVIVGNGNLGAAYRGATRAYIDSWKVYPNSCGGLDLTAVLRAYARGVAVGDKIMIAEMQAQLGSSSSVSAAANDAFDAGTVTVAANGNAGPAYSTVASPADAHKALGAGAFDVRTGTTESYQSRGPTDDMRYKPDFQVPTNTETASSSCSTCLGAFSGTSGSTPYGAAAAILLRDWFAASGYGTEPGKLHAALINFGDRYNALSDIEGAGKLELGNLYCRRWMQGARTITDGATTDVTFATVSTQKDLQVTIFWPEEPGSHNHLELRIYDPSGTLRASSTSGYSVKQKIRVDGFLTAGNWRAEIHGADVSGSQTVYYHVYHEVSPYDCD